MHNSYPCFYFRIVFLSLLLVFLNYRWIVAEEHQDADPSRTYFIVSVVYKIDGQVTKAALDEKLQLAEGVEFKSLNDLNAYVSYNNDVLSQYRSLSDGSTMLYTHVWNAELERYDVTLYVYIFAGWNIIYLPYFKYTTTSGLLLSVRGRDYNFLGSLETFFANIDYNISDISSVSNRSAHSTGLSLGFQYPFFPSKKNKNHILKYVFGEEFDLDLGLDESEDRFTNKLKSGLIYTHFFSSRINSQVGFEQRMISEIESGDNENYSRGESIVNYGMSFQLNKDLIPKIYNIPYLFEVKYTWNYHLFGENDPDYLYTKQHMSYDHQIQFGEYKWATGTFFREGYSVSVGNKLKYELDKKTPLVPQHHDSGLMLQIYAEARGHVTAHNIFGLNVRGYVLQNFFLYSDANKSGSKVGERVRGVRDDAMSYTHTAFIVNMDIMFRLFQIRSVAEFHLGPFMDFAIRSRDMATTEFNVDQDLKVTLGLEGLVHLLFANSIVIRGSYGFDVGRLVGELQTIPSFSVTNFLKNNEIYIGLSLFY